MILLLESKWPKMIGVSVFKVQISYTVFTRLVYASPKDNPAFFLDAQIFYFHVFQPELMFIERR